MTPAEKIVQKSLVASGLSSREWNGVQAGLRDRAFFSSRVESARFLHAARGMVSGYAAGGLSASEIRRDLREVLKAEGYAPVAGKAGGLQDLTSKARLDTIIDQNSRQAAGYVQHVEASSPGALAAFPAQELIRVRDSRVKRDWSQRWRAAGGRVRAGGRMAALKDDPVWLKLNAFGVPWPPFDWGSGMGVQDLSREEAEEIGLLTPSDPPPAAPAKVPGFNAKLEADVPFEAAAPEWTWLKAQFGDQIEEAGGKVRWRADLVKDALAADGGAPVSLGAPSPKLAGVSAPLVLDPEWLRSQAKGDLAPGDFDLLPTVWRQPDRATPRKAGGYDLVFGAMDGDLRLVVDADSKPVEFTKEVQP